jgi:hypothetical protein
MGCDFQLLGSQPDTKIQEACVDFLDEFTYFLRKAGNFGVGVRKPTPEDALPEETRVLRTDVLLFRPNEEFLPILREYRGESQWHADLLCGTIVESGSYFPLNVVFDNAFEGLMCTPTMPGQQDGWTEDDAPFDAVVIRPGTITRFHAGTSLLFVLGYALKHHFIPNLQMEASQDMEQYGELLTTMGWMANIQEAGADNLSQVVIDASWAVQKRYDGLAGQKNQ